MTSRRGVYPGTFNPPTVAHLAVALAARDQCDLERVDLVLSEVPLGKVGRPDLRPLATRLEALEPVVAGHDWLHTATTKHQLLADIAEGYDVVIMGADKWAQLLDVSWYANEGVRDQALSRLPHVAVAPRPPHTLPEPGGGITILEIDPGHHHVSASAVRNGELRWRAPRAEGPGRS
jgi:nicotinic acid mononucleotide adenylyltransferase